MGFQDSSPCQPINGLDFSDIRRGHGLFLCKYDQMNAQHDAKALRKPEKALAINLNFKEKGECSMFTYPVS